MALKLGEAMVKDGLITKEQLRLGLERQVIFGGRLGTNLVEIGIIKESELSSFLSKFFNVPAVNPELLVSINNETISCISKEVAEKYKAVPFRKERSRLHVALLDPLSVSSIDELRFITGYDTIPYVITELRLLFALEKYYGTERDLRYIAIFGKEEEGKTSSDRNKEHLAKVKEEFASVRDKEEIIGILLNEARRITSRVAIFLLRENRLTGWKSKGLDIENVDFPINTTSIFSDVINRKSYYRGPLLEIPGNKSLISVLSGAPQDCVMIPLQIRDKIIALLYADNGNASVMDASLNYINTLVTMASLSFEIVILRNKILAL
ncbi:MAG: hypothetical protein AB1632_02850 [Nitrospirota bacterium]